ncbi:MAG: hypothetical protein IJ745_02150 [Bacteroidales bacterium]|nr:hypothetical protein [Bacteroidales bacterium]
MANTRKSSGERFKYGICLNDDCPKCKEKTVQQIAMRKEFVCGECGKELRECPPPKKGFDKKLIIIIAAAVVVIGGGVAAALALGGGKDEMPVPEVIDTTVMAEPEAVADTVAEPEAVEDTAAVAEPETVPEVKPEPKPDASTGAGTGTSGKYSLGYGSYSGPMQGGKPHGAGGTINVTRSYQIDLKDGRGSMLDVHSGDKIANTKFENGRLRGGELQRTDGSRKWFNC